MYEVSFLHFDLLGGECQKKIYFIHQAQVALFITVDIWKIHIFNMN